MSDPHKNIWIAIHKYNFFFFCEFLESKYIEEMYFVSYETTKYMLHDK